MQGLGYRCWQVYPTVCSLKPPRQAVSGCIINIFMQRDSLALWASSSRPNGRCIQ